MIPQTLIRGSKNWVCWKNEISGKRMTKVPYYTKDVKASCSQGPWETYHAARTVASQDKKKWAGIGYVFTEDDGLLGIDIDACRDPETGDVEQWAQFYIDKLKSYTEVSPSGTGVKIIVKCEVPAALQGRAKRTRKFKNYTGHGDHSPEVMFMSHSGYFTMTGNIVRYGQVKKCQRQVNEICEELWGKASRKLDAKIADTVPAMGDKLSKFFDTADDIPIRDQADGSSRLIRLAALCRRLGLSWDQSFYCIKAYEQAHPFPKELEEEDIKKRFYDTRAEFDDVIEEDDTVCAGELTEKDVDWLWDTWVPRGALTVVEGDPGQGKSTVCYQLASRVSAGSKMPPHPVRKGIGGRNVLILTAEDDIERVVLKRLRRARANLKKIYFMRGIKTRSGMKPIYLGMHFNLLRARMEQLKPGLVMIDPLACFMDSGFDMHRDQSVRQFLFPLVALAEEHQTSLVMVRHLNKSQNQKARHRGSGSIGIAGAARSVIVCGRHPDENVQVLAGGKSSLCETPISEKYSLIDGAVEWLGQTDVGADQILDHEELGKGKDRLGQKKIDWKWRIKKIANEKGDDTLTASEILQRFRSKAVNSISELKMKVFDKLEEEKWGRQVVKTSENGRSIPAFQILNQNGKV